MKRRWGFSAMEWTLLLLFGTLLALNFVQDRLSRHRTCA